MVSFSLIFSPVCGDKQGGNVFLLPGQSIQYERKKAQKSYQTARARLAVKFSLGGVPRPVFYFIGFI